MKIFSQEKGRNNQVKTDYTLKIIDRRKKKDLKFFKKKIVF
jgi:hypothetical protein